MDIYVRIPEKENFDSVRRIACFNEVKIAESLCIGRIVTSRGKESAQLVEALNADTLAFDQGTGNIYWKGDKVFRSPIGTFEKATLLPRSNESVKDIIVITFNPNA